MPTFRGTIVDRQIILAVHVSKLPVKSSPISAPVSFRALLDTGATITSVSPKVVETLGLAPVSWHPVTGVHGTIDTATCAINITVPITEMVPDPDDKTTQALQTFSRGAHLEVAALKIEPETFDVLLGMDLLEDFHLTVHADQFILSS